MASDVPDSAGNITREALDEQDRIEMALQKEQRKGTPMSTAGCLLRGILITSILIVMASCGGYFGIQYWIAGFTAKRDALIKELRDKGEPLLAEDMARFTALPEGTNDLTERYLGILQNYRGQRVLQPGEENIPIVGGKGGGVVPGPGIEWPYEEMTQNYLANRPWLKEAEDLADVEGEISFQRDYAQGFALIIQEVQSMRDLVRDLQLQFHMRMRAGDRAGALRSLRGMFKASNVLKHEPLIVSQFVRAATHGVSVNCTCDFLRDRKATPEEIASIREMLDNDFRAGLIKALKGERAAGLITLRSSDFNQLNGVVAGGPNTMPNLPATSNIADMRPGDTAKLLEMLTESIEIAQENDFPAIMQQFKIQDDKLKQMAVDEQRALPWNRHMLPTMLLPAVQASGNAFARGTALEAALRAALDVEEKLLALPPGERTKEAEIAAIEALLPIDPYTGQPMKYLVDNQGYKIYSVGRDGIDDTATGGNANNDNGVWIERTLEKSKK